MDLPEGANSDKVTAQYDKGVLMITIEKKEGVVPKKVTVKPVDRKGATISAAAVMVGPVPHLALRIITGSGCSRWTAK